MYLDQNKRVDLARSLKTRFTDGLADFRDTAHAGVERDPLSFQLSAVCLAQLRSTTVISDLKDLTGLIVAHSRD